jgi:hypothetical protein
MKVTLSTSLLWAGYWYHSGDEVDLPDELAHKYIRAGSAELITEPIAGPIETAALRTTPPKGKYDVRNPTARAK